MKVEGSYIQYASGYDKDNITIKDIIKALDDLKQMDKEHGAFWVGVYGENIDEVVLEVHKNKVLFGNFGDKEYKIQLDNLKVCKHFFDLLLNGSIEELKEKFKK